MTIKHINSFGIFGGASLNGVETALIETDGLDIFEVKNTSQVFYPENLANDIRSVMNLRELSLEDIRKNEKIRRLEENVTRFYAEIINDTSEKFPIDVVGVDGLTIFNKPEEICSYQIDKGNALHNLVNKKIITHFHKSDLLAGGQASPLSPVFFNAITQKIQKPLLIIDIEAVSSLVHISETGWMVAFDCAPGTAMIEDWAYRHAGMQTDYNGKMAALGKVNEQIIESLLNHKILRKNPPKSLDIRCFDDKKEHLEGLTVEDGAATATAFIAKAVFKAAKEYLSDVPENIILTGVGAKNPTLRRKIKQEFAPLHVEDLGNIYANNEEIGAQVVAFNAVRRLNNMHITYPSTTGAYEPLSGGEIYE